MPKSNVKPAEADDQQTLRTFLTQRMPDFSAGCMSDEQVACFLDENIGADRWQYCYQSIGSDGVWVIITIEYAGRSIQRSCLFSTKAGFPTHMLYTTLEMFYGTNKGEVALPTMDIPAPVAEAMQEEYREDPGQGDADAPLEDDNVIVEPDEELSDQIFGSVLPEGIDPKSLDVPKNIIDEIESATSAASAPEVYRCTSPGCGGVIPKKYAEKLIAEGKPLRHHACKG